MDDVTLVQPQRPMWRYRLFDRLDRILAGWGPYEKRILLLVFLAALVARLAYIILTVGLSSPPSYDGVDYDHFAVNLLNGQGYSGHYGPTALKPPVYSLFLAALYGLFGHSLVVVRIAQALIGAGACILLYFMTKRLAGSNVGLLAALGAAFHPLLIYVTGIVYAETLFLFLLVAALFFLARSIQEERTWECVASGLLLGLAVLTRPGIVSFVPFAVLTLLLVLNRRKRWIYALLLSICVVLVLLPWIGRNYVVFHGFVPLTTEGGATFWTANNPLAKGGSVMPSEETWNGSPPPPTRAWAGWAELNEQQSSAKFIAQALLWITQNPSDFVGLIPLKVIRLWSPAEFTVHSDRSKSELLSKALIPPYILFLALVVCGAISSCREWRLLTILYGLIVSTTLNAILYGGGTRFSVGMLPALLIFAALGCGALERWLTRTRLAAQE